MYTLVLILHIIVSFVLIAVILFQAGKGGGLADTFGGGGGGGSQTTIFGHKASDFLTKATEVSAVLFLCTSLSLAFLSSKRKKSIMESVKIAPVEQKSQAPETVTEKEVKIDPEAEKKPIVK
jgi:preprotein translocase subunit SecG